MMGSYCGMLSGQTYQDSWNNIQLHSYKRWRKTIRGEQEEQRLLVLWKAQISAHQMLTLCSFQLFSQTARRNTTWRMKAKFSFQLFTECLAWCEESRDKHLGSGFSPHKQDHPTKENKMNKPTVVYPDDCTGRCQTRKTTIHYFVWQRSVTVCADMGSINWMEVSVTVMQSLPLQSEIWMTRHL